MSMAGGAGYQDYGSIGGVIREYPDRVFLMHMHDYDSTHDHLAIGKGNIDFEEIIRALNQIGYDGPLSVEWEDSGMDREHGAKEACEFVRKLDFEPSRVAFDAAFER